MHWKHNWKDNGWETWGSYTFFKKKCDWCDAEWESCVWGNHPPYLNGSFVTLVLLLLWCAGVILGLLYMNNII